MLKSNSKAVPVNSVLKIDMIVDGAPEPAGGVVELSARDFKYLHNFGRVLPATDENIKAVRAEIATQKESQRKVAAAADELTSTKSQLATALAELAALKKGK